MKEAGLSGFDRFLGALLGVVKGGLVVAVVLMGMTAFTPTSKMLENSQLAPYFLVVGRAAIWVAPSELRARFYQGLDFLHRAPKELTGTPAPTVEISACCRARTVQNKDIERRERPNVKDQLEALILQMYKSNILYSEGVREFKKRFILTVLQENKGNQCRAARELGMHRNTLSRTIDELKIDVRQLRDGAKRPPRSARPVSLEKKAVR